METNLRALSPRLKVLKENLNQVIIGKDAVMELMLTALLADGHVLLEDVPGVGKTMLAKSLARSIAGTYRRVQFTPDLLPSDVTGLNYFDQKAGEFEFRPGPVFTNIMLADEINRATPRTQSSLLEAMEERQVTIDGVTHPLPRPFLVMATQNPLEQAGTFPLPEAQIDRFLFRLSLGYPTAEEEGAIIDRFSRGNPLAVLEPVWTLDDVEDARQAVRGVHVAPTVRDYLVAVARATRDHGELRYGASPRATLGLHRAAQAFALVRGRNYVVPDDVKVVALPALAHRLIVASTARLKGKTPEGILREILNDLPVPVE